MITPQDIENASRLARALKHYSESSDLRGLRSALLYDSTSELEQGILSLCRIVADSFPSSVVGSHVGGGVVFVPLPAIDEDAERVEQCKSCANLKALEDGRLTPEEFDGICAACEECYQRRYLAHDE